MAAPDLVQLFANELLVHCTTLEETGVGLLCRDPAAEERAALRALHTLKGNSALMGFDELAEYLHRVEDAARRAQTLGKTSLGKLLVALADQLRACSGGTPPVPATVPAVEVVSPQASAVAPPRLPLEALRVSVEAEHLRAAFAASEKLRAHYVARQQLAEAQRQEALSRTLLTLCQLPVQPVATKLRRVVLGVAEALGREVELVVQGDHHKTDAALVEALSTALPHLVRNALDHGLEGPAERERMGKPRTASLRVAFSEERGKFTAVVADDGRGIDVQSVSQRARAAGIVSERELAAMTNYQRLMLIFRAGFSTRDAATAISGRGVGLDAVLDAVVRAGGDVQVDSTPGAGTRFTLSFPLGLQWSEHLVAEVGTSLVGIPVDCVKHVWDVDELPDGDGTCIEVAGDPVPLIGFAALDRRLHDRVARPVVLLELEGAVVAMYVDRLVGFAGALAHPIEASIAGSYISGIARDEHGCVVWLLDSGHLTRNWNAYVIPEHGDGDARS